MIGIEAVNVYCGPARIGVPALFEGRGLDPKRLDNLMMDERAVNLPIEDTVTNAVNAAAPLVRRLDDEDRAKVGILIVSTESGVDYSKSVSSYVHKYLGLSRNCRIVEVKQACYAATAALQLSAGYLASGASPGGKALVIGSDVALVDGRAQYAEPATGAGAAAVLLGSDPRILQLDIGAFGAYGYETLDSARPGPEFDIADSDRSLFAYLDCLTNSYQDYAAKVDAVNLRKTFDHLAMHTPFAGMVRAAHRKLMRDHTDASRQEVSEDFERRVAPSLHYPRQVGNLCSASVYLALCSLIDQAQDTAGARVGLFSYGSGCASEFFSAVISPGAAAELAGMRIGARLRERVELTFEEYEALLAENVRCLTPVADRSTDVERYAPLARRGTGGEPTLVFTGAKDYHRTYEWLSDV